MARRPFVYISGPIQVGDRMEQFTKANRLFLMLQGHRIYSYVPHWSMLLTHMLFADDVAYNKWLELDLQVVPRCDALIRLRGESAGADQEFALAHELGIPLFHESNATLEQVCGYVVNHFKVSWKG